MECIEKFLETYPNCVILEIDTGILIEYLESDSLTVPQDKKDHIHYVRNGSKSCPKYAAYFSGGVYRDSCAVASKVHDTWPSWYPVFRFDEIEECQDKENVDFSGLNELL